ncbi:MAG: ATP-binding protein [Anaerolineae bacterium]|nr:ATP-binding protein [Anaerolineae bacterium]
MSDEPESADIVQPVTAPGVVGRISATERDGTTSDKFSFWLGNDIIINPFDIVEVDQVSQQPDRSSRTYGLVTTLEHRTDAPSHLANFISSNFGEVEEEPQTLRQGTTVAHVNVLSNDEDIYMPVPNGQPTRFASAEGIERALGIDQMKAADRIAAGLIKMSNGASTVAYLDRRYLLGPDGAHMNISGISGLATKTSYAMFMLQAILQKAEEQGERDKFAVIILNVKQADLLQIDKRPDRDLPVAEMEKWESLSLEPRPFGQVHYLLPRSTRGDRPNSFFEPDGYTVYAYDLEGTADKLDLLFTDVYDPSGTMESMIGEVMQGIQAREADLRDVRSWQQLLNGPPLFANYQPQPWRGHVRSSVGKFRRHLRRVVQTRQSGIFTDARAANEKLLADEMLRIRGGHVYVVDIAKLHDEEQTLVFGDMLRSIYELKAEPPEDRREPIPERIIFFVDELNKYAPKGERTSPITQQVLEIAERGRSLGVILISAQQFMSSVHPRVTGNAATRILGRAGSAEVFQPDYRFLDDDLKLNMTRLAQGELIVSHNVYRQPVKVVFPMPAYKQEQF